MTQEHPEQPKKVPVEPLRELVKRWNDAADYAENEGYLREYDGIMGCADELEQTIEAETGGQE